jgi:hypothetical protein
MISEYVDATLPERREQKSGSIIERDSAGEQTPRVGEGQTQSAPRALFGREFYRKPQQLRKKEKYEHRLMILMKAAGASTAEIAEALGVTVYTVRDVLAQPYAIDAVVGEIEKHGQDAIQTVIKGATLDSVLKLIELRDADDSPKEVQRKAANDILDRAFGKPNQSITHKNEDVTALSDAELEAIIAKSQLVRTN